MGKYKIKILPAAQYDLKDIVEYLNTLSPKTAIEHYDLIVKSIGSLSVMPQRCALTRDSQLRMKGYRFLPVKNYIVFYVVKSKAVEIRRILYASRQYEMLL